MNNHNLKETMIQEEKAFKDWELYLKNLYFSSKIQESYLKSFPKIPKAFTALANEKIMINLNYPCDYKKFISSITYPEHLQYSEDFIYGGEFNFAEKLLVSGYSGFSVSLKLMAIKKFQRMNILGIDYCLKGGFMYLLNKYYKSGIYIKKELLRKIFLFTLEGYLSDTNIHIDFDAYDNWPINEIKFTQEYRDSGKLCREFFDSVAHIQL